MLKKELTFDVIKALREMIDMFLPELVQKVRENLGLRNLALFNRVFESFYCIEEVSGRWYDKYHIPLAVLFASKAVKLGQVPPETVPAIILHDIGYAFIDPDLKNRGEDKEDLEVVRLSRILHMQKAAGPAAKIISENGNFSPDETGSIVDVVVSHDNGCLGLPIEENPLFLAVRDADRTFVMHFISFYKDWLSIAGQRPDFTPLDLYRSRLVTFYESDQLSPHIWFSEERFTEEDKFNTQRAPYAPLAEEWRDTQFAACWQELNQNILRSETVFRQYAKEHIQAELMAGRG